MIGLRAPIATRVTSTRTRRAALTVILYAARSLMKLATKTIILELALQILRKCISTRRCLRKKVLIENGSDNACDCKHGIPTKKATTTTNIVDDSCLLSTGIASQNRELRSKNQRRRMKTMVAEMHARAGHTSQEMSPERKVKCGLWRYSFHLYWRPFLFLYSIFAGGQKIPTRN